VKKTNNKQKQQRQKFLILSSLTFPHLLLLCFERGTLTPSAFWFSICFLVLTFFLVFLLFYQSKGKQKLKPKGKPKQKEARDLYSTYLLLLCNSGEGREKKEC